MVRETFVRRGPTSWIRPQTPPGVNALVTSRRYPEGRSQGAFGGFNLAEHVGDDPQAVALNRSALSELFPDLTVQWLRQVHGVHCVDVTRATEPAPEADAAVTQCTDVGLAILSADCVPVLLWDAQAQEVAACHAGWQGLAAQVVMKTVKQMVTPVDRIQAYVGPAIGGDRYQVGAEVWQKFDRPPFGTCLASYTGSGDGSHDGAHDSNSRLLDLAAVARLQLQSAGVETIQMSNCCTYRHSDFYSHRAHVHASLDGHCGRFASLIWLAQTRAASYCS